MKLNFNFQTSISMVRSVRSISISLKSTNTSAWESTNESLLPSQPSESSPSINGHPSDIVDLFFPRFIQDLNSVSFLRFLTNQIVCAREMYQSVQEEVVIHSSFVWFVIEVFSFYLNHSSSTTRWCDTDAQIVVCFLSS
mmetsp:Transcript_10653/g.23240  ORF Transcript_10653/g.23240 Transcript_10653/m.23240 type:complete len:139 (+) Transcript_10653:295-711(+)